MKARVNIQLLKTTTFDSGALGLMAMVLHQFSLSGNYRATIIEQGRMVANIDFQVNEKSEEMQLDVDLYQAVQSAKAFSGDCGRKGGRETIRVVSPKGHVLFYVSSGYGYSVAVENEAGEVVFDSTKLSNGDLFAVTMLEPASYLMKNTLGTSEGEIAVSLTQEMANRLSTIETSYIDVSSNGFVPDNVKLTASKGLVFRINDSARIVIEKKTDETYRLRSEKDKPAIRWQKLQAAKKEMTEQQN